MHNLQELSIAHRPKDEDLDGRLATEVLGSSEVIKVLRYYQVPHLLAAGGRTRTEEALGGSFIDKEKCRGSCPSSQSVARRPRRIPQTTADGSHPISNPPPILHIEPRDRPDRADTSTASLLAPRRPLSSPPAQPHVPRNHETPCQAVALTQRYRATWRTLRRGRAGRSW